MLASARARVHQRANPLGSPGALRRGVPAGGTGFDSSCCQSLDHAAIRHQFDAGLRADRDVDQWPLCRSQRIPRLAVELLSRPDAISARIDGFTRRRAGRHIGQVPVVPLRGRAYWHSAALVGVRQQRAAPRRLSAFRVRRVRRLQPGSTGSCRHNQRRVPSSRWRQSEQLAGLPFAVLLPAGAIHLCHKILPHFAFRLQSDLSVPESYKCCCHGRPQRTCGCRRRISGRSSPSPVVIFPQIMAPLAVERHARQPLVVS
jgi:hypothetical protein